MLRALLFIFISEHLKHRSETILRCVCASLKTLLSFFSLRNEIFIRTISVFGRLSLNSFVSESAICTRRPLIFRGPICGTHGTLSRLRSKCWQRSRRGDKNTLQCRLHSEDFPSLFFPKSVSSSVQTELSQQLRTPDAPSIGPGTFYWAGGGQQAKVSCFSEIVHHNGLPAFSEPPSPVWPHTLWLLCLVRCSGWSLGIFTLLLYLSTVQTENNT